MAIVRQYHKDTDTTYVYESTRYWDEAEGKSKAKRKLIGKIDPETGEIVPTGGRGRKKGEGTDQEAAEELKRVNIHYSNLLQENMDLKTEIKQLKSEISALNKKIQNQVDLLKEILDIAQASIDG